MSGGAMYPPQAEETTADRAPGIVEDFAKMAELLRQEVNMLYDRLTAVLKPEYDDRVNAGEPRQAQSPIREVLETFDSSLRRLMALRDRLEV